MRTYLFNLRHERRLTQAELARLTGLGQSYYHAIEHGERQQNMKLSTIEKLADALNLPVQTIINAETDYRARALNEEAYK